MPRDLIEDLLGYIKGPSYFKHFLIGTIGSDSARARLSGASRYCHMTNNRSVPTTAHQVSTGFNTRRISLKFGMSEENELPC